jgi:glucosylceramidase
MPSPAHSRVVAALSCLWLAGCGGGGAPSAGCPSGTELIGGSCQSPGPSVQVVVTTGDQSRLLARDPDLRFGGGAPATINIDVDAATRYQSYAGVGAALTDSAAWVLQHDLAASGRSALLADLFGPAGGGLTQLRITVGASDFSLSQYSLDDAPAGQPDPTLARFSIAPLRADVLPTLHEIAGLQPALRVMASPWSAPAWMKANQSLVRSPDPAVQGTLLPADYDAFAEYLVRFAEALQAEGLPLAAMTLQNEPAYEPADYPGMLLDAPARAALLSGYVGPRFVQRVPAVQLLEWDHNWDAPGEPLAVLGDAAARPYVAGVAWHCYAGDVSAQSTVHDAFPDKDAWITECSGGGWAPVWRDNFDWIVGTLLIDGMRNWARGVLLWNLALDSDAGPHSGGCGNCRGVVTVDAATGAVTRNEEYYALAQLARFVRPGAQRIASSAAQDGVSSVAFRNIDDGSLVLLVLNSNAAARSFSVRHAGRTVACSLPAGSAATFSWQPPP